MDALCREEVINNIESLMDKCNQTKLREALYCIKYLVEHTLNVIEYNGKVLVVLDDGNIIPLSMKPGKRLKQASNYFAKVHHKIVEFDTRYKVIKEAYLLVMRYWLSILKSNKEGQ